MPTVDLAANQVYDVGNWVKVGGQSDVYTINTDDNSTTHYWVPDFPPATWLHFYYDDMPPDAVSINTLTQYGTFFRQLDFGFGGVYGWSHRYGGVNYDIGATLFPASWAMHNSGPITFGAGGGWTIQKVNDSIFGVKYIDCDEYGQSVYLTSYHMVRVDYVATGMFVVLLSLPLLGIITSSFDRIMRQLLPKVRYTQEELEKIRQDIRNSQRAYSFPVQGLNRLVIK